MKIIVILLLIGSVSFSRDYPAKVIRVKDGDTYVAEIDLGFNTVLVEPVRMSNYSAPERNEEGGSEATERLEERLLGKEIIIRTGNRERDKYGRVLAEIIEIKP